MSVKGYCTFLSQLQSDERYEHLKRLGYNGPFLEVIRLLPEGLREEFWRFEKVADLESTLQHEVSSQAIQGLIQKGKRCLQSLVDQWSAEDEYWYYHAFPGDTGYALVREKRIVAYCTLEITTATFGQCDCFRQSTGTEID